MVIEVALTDADGARHLLVAKEPMFGGAGSFTASTPVPVTVFCELLEIDGDEALITTASPHGVETEDGRSEFRVRLDQLGEVVAPSNELVRTFMTAGAAAGATKMFLTTGADNAGARALYDSLGGGLAEQGPTVNYWFLLDRHG